MCTIIRIVDFDFGVNDIFEVLIIINIILEFFTNSELYKNVNIINFILALALKINWFNKTCDS